LDNEEEIEVALARLGFTVVCPELPDIPSQIGLFAKASTVVGELSSALHNTIFWPPRTAIVELNPLNNIQRSLSAALHHKLVTVAPDDGKLRRFPAANDISKRFTIHPKRIVKAIHEAEAAR
jgi:capsular polysaccharide biosynthesis protein